MANATEREQVPVPSRYASVDTGTKITSLTSVVARKTPALPGIVEMHGKISALTFRGTGFDAATAA